MRYVVLSLILLFVFTGVCDATGTYVSSSDVVTGLADAGWGSTPNVFNDSGTLKLISGGDKGTFFGYYHDGSSWISNSSIVAGLGDVGLYSAPAVYDDGGTWKLISGTYNTGLHGFYWDGSSWVSDASIATGLWGSGGWLKLSVYNYSGTFNAIVGGGNGLYTSFDWNGSEWISNSSIAIGLVDYGQDSAPTVYNDNGLKLISGSSHGTFYGYDWTGAEWISNSSIVSGLGANQDSTPTVYNDGSTLKLISGGEPGIFYGFQWNHSPALATSFTDLGNYVVDQTPTITWTKGTDVDGDVVTTYIYVGTSSTPTSEEGSTALETFDLGTTITLSDGITFYYRLRSWDGYSWSNYTTADQFRMNSAPSVSSATISPSPANTSQNLTVLNGSASDPEGDTVSLFYKWYKAGIHQPALNNISTVLADNTTAGEVWKVGIIPNDGYENGTEVQSATVTIDSLNVAPTLIGITANASIKYNKTILITTRGASDANGDNYTLSIGSTSGGTDLCVNGNVTNGTQATCKFLVPWTSGTHAIYGFLNDSEDISIIYSTVVTVDTTPPVIGTTSLSSTSVLAGANLTITASVTVANGSISTVHAVINGVNYAMSGANGTYAYMFNTQAGGEYSVTYSATDDSGNIGYKLTPDSFQIVPSEGSGGGGGGDTYINETVLGDLTLSPPELDTYFFYTGMGEIQTATAVFYANRVIESCSMLPNDIATCAISGDNNNIITLNVSVNDSMQFYSGVLSVVDAKGFSAMSKVTIRIKNVGAFKAFSSPINVGEDVAKMLNLFFATDGENIIGARWWAMLVTLGILLIVVFRDSSGGRW